MNYTQLAEEAVKAKSKAHPPYSHFHVGAALLTQDNKIYLGANIENSSYSLTICAERTAVFNAYLEGERKFKAMAITSDATDFCPPCGACRQVISDLCGNIDIVLINQKKETKVLKLSELLPFAFGEKDLK
jgi:cytidine deaminase